MHHSTGSVSCRRLNSCLSCLLLPSVSTLCITPQHIELYHLGSSDKDSRPPTVHWFDIHFPARKMSVASSAWPDHPGQMPPTAQEGSLAAPTMLRYLNPLVAGLDWGHFPFISPNPQSCRTRHGAKLSPQAAHWANCLSFRILYPLCISSTYWVSWRQLWLFSDVPQQNPSRGNICQRKEQLSSSPKFSS